VLHPKYLKYVARAREGYVRMMECTQKVKEGDKVRR